MAYNTRKLLNKIELLEKSIEGKVRELDKARLDLRKLKKLQKFHEDIRIFLSQTNISEERYKASHPEKEHYIASLPSIADIDFETLKNDAKFKEYFPETQVPKMTPVQKILPLAGHCSKCTISISGEFIYLKSSQTDTLCASCDENTKVIEDDGGVIYKALTQI